GRARISLNGRIDNIQTSWVKLGTTGTQVMLRSGANDLGGTLMEETISRMAGSQHGSAKTVAELTEIAEGIGRPVRERTTTYGIPPSRGPVPGLELVGHPEPPAHTRRWTTSVVRGPSRSGATERGSEAEERRSEERDQWGPEPATPEAAPIIRTGSPG